MAVDMQTLCAVAKLLPQSCNELHTMQKALRQRDYFEPLTQATDWQPRCSQRFVHYRGAPTQGTRGGGHMKYVLRSVAQSGERNLAVALFLSGIVCLAAQFAKADTFTFIDSTDSLSI